MISRKNALIIVSTLLLNGALYCPDFLGLLVFIFLVPLYCAWLYTPSFSFKDGFLWGALFFALHWYGLQVMAVERGEGGIRFFVVPVLTLYFSLYAGIWFKGASSVALLVGRQRWAQGIVWSVSSAFYFMVIKGATLWIFGDWAGYGLSFPLVPLAAYPHILGALPWLSSAGALLCISFFSWSLACAFYERDYGASLWCALAMILPFVVPYFFFKHRGEAPPQLLASIGVIVPSINKTHSLDYAQELQNRIIALLAQRASISAIIMPESAYPYPLNLMPEAQDLFFNALNGARDDCTLLIGSYKEEANKVQNSLYYIGTNAIIADYDKTKRIPFVEYLPYLATHLPTMKNLFLKNKKESAATEKVPPPLFFAGCWWQPAICADLFLEAPHVQRGDLPLLCIVNDRWFSQNYMRELMRFFARYKALCAQQEMIYVGHYGGVWISKYGDIVNLFCL